MAVMAAMAGVALLLGKGNNMKYAIIENGKVTNLARADAPLAENWIDAASAKIGDTWDGESFTTPAPPVPTAEELLAATRAAYIAAMSVISADYPDEEREGWAEQTAAAQEVIAGGQNDLIDALSAPRGIAALDMANIIMAKRAQYQAVYGAMTANLHRLDALISAAVTVEDLAAIDTSAGWEIPAA